MNIKWILCAALVTTVSACAKRPEDIAAASINTGAYDRLSCRQLAVEETKISNALASLSADQNSAANSDAMGVFLLGLPISSMSGNDLETDIAIAKGEIAAINEVQARKNCS